MSPYYPSRSQFLAVILKRKEAITLVTIDYKFLDEVLEKHNSDGTKIIPIMQQVQEKYRYLPKEALTYIASRTGLSEAKLYGVATFYSNFSLEGKGKYVLKVCRGTACHVRKSANVLNALYEATGLSDTKTTTDDGLISIEVVSCLGACALSPVVMVNDVVHAAMTPDKAKDLVVELRAEG
jgi:NADH-quinone oxidoreductase subunit E